MNQQKNSKDKSEKLEKSQKEKFINLSNLSAFNNQYVKYLFICKQRSKNKYGSFGLINSAKFVSNYLNKSSNNKSKVVQLIDSNEIDKTVCYYNPIFVFIEALWVTPQKILELLSIPCHKSRKWIVRIHSKFPFLANEGIAFQWLNDYANIMRIYPNLYVAPNTNDTTNFLKHFYNVNNFVFLPNIYENSIENLNNTKYTTKYTTKYKLNENFYENFYSNFNNNFIHIGCFGAIRPLKNQLIQAIAAIQFAKSI